MTQSIRMINLGPMKWLRTQSVYRSTAELLDEKRPDTIIMGTPLNAYTMIGDGQNPADLVDLGLCAELEVPVLTSPLSAPITYADSLSIVSQWVFHKKNVTELVDALLRGTIEGLETLGLSGAMRTEDSVLVEDRPIRCLP